MTDLDPRELRNALGAFATGVAIVTTNTAEGQPVAMTVNSFASVSLDPPLVLWSVQRTIRPFTAFNLSNHYAVHVLHAGQEDLANHFSRDMENKCAGIAFTSGIEGLPLLEDYTARFQCRVEQRFDGGDHMTLLGRVLTMDHRPAEPLVFHAGSYRR